VDFLPDFVASRVGVFVTELSQQTLCSFYFLVFYFAVLIMFTASTVGTLNGTYVLCAFEIETSHKTACN